MNKKDFDNRLEMIYMGGAFVPHNDKAFALAEQCTKGEVVDFLEITARDLKFHKCYMALLNFIYGYMPQRFKNAVPEKKFYHWLKHLQGKYEIVFEYKDGTKLVEYPSLAFGNMSEKRFREYIKKQLPFIYSDVIGAFYEGKTYDDIIQTIEDEFEIFMQRL